MRHTVTAGPRPLGVCRGVAVLAGALTTALAAGALVAPAPAAAASRLPVSQPLVVLLHDAIARSRPDVHAPRVETVATRRPLTHLRTILPVLDRRSALPGGLSWVQIRLPGRPNSHKGWIPAARTRRATTGWRLVVKLSSRRVTVYRDGRAARHFSAIVGKPSTPTPVGHFFIEEALALSPKAAGGPFALATSARSEVLQEFAGGPGQIALHGTANLPGELGTAVSHGCVRLSPRAITWLARHIGRGVPLTITR